MRIYGFIYFYSFPSVLGGNAYESSKYFGTQGYGGFIGRTVIMAVVGGTASVLGGGKFASGAMAGAFMQMFNAEMVGYPKKFLKVSNAGSVTHYMKRYNMGKTDAVALMHWRREIDRQHMNKAMDVLGLGLSVGSAISPPGVAIRLGLVAWGIDASQSDYGGMLTGAVALPPYRGNPRLGIVTSIVDIGYGIWQVAK